MATSDKPLIVIVSGAPGSGKSTFARRLADHMALPHIDRDTFFWGLSYTIAGRVDRKTVGIREYYDLLVYMLQHGVSVVTDGTLYRNLSEGDIIERLVPIARVVNVHCRAEGEYERFYARELARHDGEEPAWLAQHKAHLEAIYPDVVDPLDLGAELIEVNTTAEYVPSLHEVAHRIGDRNHTTRKG